MSAAVLDPAAAITAVQRELYDKLRELVDAGPVDDLLERVRKLTTATGRKITRVRKAAAPAKPAEPASAPVSTKPAATRATVTIPTKRDAPTQAGSVLGRRVHLPTSIGSSSPSTTPAARRAPAAWLPAALLLITVTALTAGGDYLVAGIVAAVAAVAVPAGRWIRRRWSR